jgi:hypothetical protein
MTISETVTRVGRRARRVIITLLLGTGLGTALIGSAAAELPTAVRAATLPDGRAWELVTPPNKSGALIEAITHEGGVIEASESGSALTYVAVSPPVENPEGNPAYAYSQMMATRGPDGGWSNRDIATPHSEVSGLRAGYLAEYLFFTPNLTSSLLDPHDETNLSPEASQDTIYVRTGLLNPGSHEYAALVNDHNVPAGTEYGRIPRAVTGSEQLLYMGASANLEHVAIYSKTALTTGPSGFAGKGLYEWTAGALHPVSLLPDGEWAENPQLGLDARQVDGAVSSNGELVFWEDELGELFVRNMRTETTTLINTAAVPGEELSAAFQYATPDGSKVYFTSGQRLSTNATAEPGLPELYEYNTATRTTTDLTPNPEHTGADVQGELLNTSTTGSYIYFVAHGVLAPGATTGEDNLYVENDGAIKFIASLSAEDQFDWKGRSALTPNLAQRTARTSPDGRYMAFMSNQRLTGYDNDDAASGVPDEEVYLYDAGSAKLVCASCDPSGALPHGVDDEERVGEGLGLLVDRPEEWSGRWLAGSLPGWTSYAENYAQYPSRSLSNEGRLFFNSADSLVPQDTNGKEDVYEYEPSGVGTCSNLTSTYSAATGSCVSLISSGTSGRESAFLDASESGNDVFFLTAASLTAEDTDASYDIYDAHVCAGAPCPTATPPSPEPCAASNSCEPGGSAVPPDSGVPATSTFTGIGNVLPQATVPAVAKPRPLTRAQKLAAALRACAKHRKKQRAACRRTAEKRYGPVPKGKKAA